ncbi:sister chromatid cohesion C-terminus-domain-containing protein [Cadophora sp. MPI-SDFR-AT-0126]|nr:sister chromatid cohesion C-terminus-domain-containing protein [Leotiomycetes sp. MPI-SDFR-AT-0126]
MSVEVGTEGSGYNDCDKKAAAQTLYRSLQEAFKIEKEIPDTASEFQVIDIDRIGHLYSVLSNIKQHLREVLALSSLSQVPLEDILRLRKLCEERLNAARIIEFKLEDNPGREHQAMMSDCGLLSGYICLLIRSGGRQEIQLCSGNVFQIVSDALRNVLETCIIPTLIPANQLQSFAATKPFTALISACEQILGLLATLVGGVKFPETVLDTLEWTALLLLFADNGAEKTGLKKLRTAALDVLGQVFHYHPTRRPSILNEILTSLKKTSASQNSRDFKLLKGGSIQVVSALIMQIIQSAASGYDDSHFNEGNTSLASELSLEADRLKAFRTAVRQPSLKKSAKKGKPMIVQALSALVSPLLDTATNIAMQIIDFVIGRALSPTKTRDESFRNLLYIFVEDFVRSFDCPEWPAAELLLRLILFKMIRLLEAEKTTSTVKLMAVDVLGLMGAAISGLNFNIRHATQSEDFKTNLSWCPRKTIEESLQLKPRLEDITSLGGPFHASVEFLTLQSALEPQTHGAVGYLTAQWAFSAYDSTGIDTDPKNNRQERSLLATRLQKIIAGKLYEPKAFDPHCVTASNARVAYSLTLLRSQFCESFSRLLEVILDSAKSPHASIRCRSLKVVLHILEADPFLIGRTPAVKTLICGRTKDISVSVRESSLRLISKCIELTPELGVEMMPNILRRVTDESVAVRKRAMKILKDIYLQNPEANARSGIAEALLYRAADLDQSVRELASQSIEEIWISPHLPASTKKVSSKTTLATTSHVSILLHPSRGSATFRVYSLFVARMFNMIDKSTAKGNTTVDVAATFQLLLIFAKTNANIFTNQQIQLLQPYVGKIGTGDDMMIYRRVILILYRTLPRVSDVDPAFLRSMSTDLIKQITRFNRAILSEVIPCLWTISEILQDIKPLTTITLSCLEHIRNMADLCFHDPAKQEAVRKVKKLLLIAGMCGRYCHFEAQLEHFQMRFTDCHSVSDFMIGTFLPFSSSGQPVDLRKVALDAICMVCQVRPKHFTSSVVTTLFEEAFEEKNSLLETVILQAFKEFLLAEEQYSKVSSRVATKLDHVGASQLDGVAASITQMFASNRKDLMRIALATQGDQALLATDILASMARQGLLHPKECAQICIALETSQNRKIAELSFITHQTLHQKFESIIKDEHLRAVEVAYEYQRDVVHNVRGATCDPYLSILHRMMEVTKAGKIKGRKKFFEGLCARIEPDLSPSSSIDVPQHLQRSQFILENIAFFEYASAEELNATVFAMERVFTRAGIAVVDAIETELLGQTTPIAESQNIDFNRLRTLAASSTTLSGLWDTMTYLRQQYGLSCSSSSITQEASNNSSRAPNKVDGIDGRAFWESNSMVMTTLDSEQNMLNICRAFIELFHEGICSEVIALDGSALPKKTPTLTGAKEGDKVKGRKRKVPPNRSSEKRRKVQRKR